MERVENHIIGHLRRHSSANPGKPAFIFLEDGEQAERTISFGELNTRVEQLGSVLAERQPQGQRALLVYQDIMEFTVSFLACQHAGLIAVPVFLSKGSKQVARFINLMEDAGVSLILSTSDLEAQVQQVLSGYLQTSGIELVATESIRGEAASPRGAGKSGIAFIQYTSGSTGRPKGVVVTRENLMHNELLIQNTFGCDSSSVIFSWLPFHHDMGLIGNILHTIYVGCTCVLMSPYHFMQRPRRWLEGITKYKATHSGGPNFAYDFCLGKIPPAELEGLDLSSWKVAYNGSEPVRAETIRRFSRYFEKVGFRQNVFYPCYGLAEATLLVSGGKDDKAPAILFIEKDPQSRNGIVVSGKDSNAAKPVVSSGRPAPETYVKIISLHDGSECNELEEGEICIAGGSVTEGYWNKDNSSYFLEVGGRRFLRTGDLGFLHEGELFIHGRIKEMLIIRGENYYPYDIEHAAAENTRAVENNGVAIFTLDPGEEVVVVAEVKRSALKDLDAAEAITSIDKAVNGSFGINPHDIILTTPLGIPRTTSGKLQRVKCKELYRQGGFEVIASKKGLYRGSGEEKDNSHLLDEVIGEGSYKAIRSYLLHLIETKTGVLGEPAADTMELTEMGIDSVRAMELINTINRDLNINMDATKVFQNNTLSGFINVIENLLWLKNEQNSGKSIVI